MKLKYILPVATIASVASVVTPLAVSCGQKWDYEYDLAAKEFTPETKQLESYSGDKAKIIEKYLTDVKSNKKIMADDFAYTMNMQVYDEEADKAFVCKVKIDKVDPTNKMLTVSAYYKSEEKESGLIIENNFTFKNMLVDMTYTQIGATDYAWMMVPTVYTLIGQGKFEEAIKLIKDNQSSIKGQSTETTTYGASESYIYDVNPDNITEEAQGAWSTLYRNCRIISWYLGKIPK